ncbi:uncharacterized protein LOC110446901 [Mizuhopecten yessoensis]|uniref:uncharacterized protein LOC110446901 n=1 Tax=Mizuhopecten yessoensis TaxID=6573 RepID=UPI000B45BA5C|nr:uncharacterized protein LOC110446901 [Mizuhopecten yessoensis]
MKAAFSLFIMSTTAQVLMALTDTILLCCSAKKEASLKYECKYLKIIVHFCSGVGISIATIIFGLKHPGKVSWSFWLTVVAAILAVANALVWLLTQHDKRALKRAGVNVKHLQDGKMADGTDRES